MVTCRNCNKEYSFREFEALGPADTEDFAAMTASCACGKPLYITSKKYEQCNELYNGTDRVGVDDSIVNAILDSRDGDVEDALNDLGDRWWGIHDSPRDWAEDMLTSCGVFEGVDATLVMYFNFEEYACDAELGGEYNFVPVGHGQVAVTSNR